MPASTTFEEDLRKWTRAQMRQPTESDRAWFSHFLDWVKFNDLAMPVEGEEVAEYLLEQMMEGATLSELERAAKAIALYYSLRSTYLDMMPVKGALAMAQAQLDPNRTLN